MEYWIPMQETTCVSLPSVGVHKISCKFGLVNSDLVLCLNSSYDMYICIKLLTLFSLFCFYVFLKLNQVFCTPIFQKRSRYSEVIMTGVLIVCSIVCSGADEKEHQSSASLAFVRGIHRWPLDSPHKGLVTRKMFPFNDVILVLILSHCIMCLPWPC